MAIKLEDIRKEKEKAELRDIEALNERLEKAKNININEEGTNIELDDFASIQLQGRPMDIELNIQRCDFCGHVGTADKPLFTTDDKHYICKPCLIFGFRTMLLNDIKMPSVEEMGDKENAEFNAYDY